MVLGAYFSQVGMVEKLQIAAQAGQEVGVSA
jgi:hypothetical protein